MAKNYYIELPEGSDLIATIQAIRSQNSQSQPVQQSPVVQNVAGVAPVQPPVVTPVDTSKSLDLVGIIAGLTTLVPVIVTAVQAFTPKVNAQNVATQPLVQPQVNASVVQLSPEQEEKLKLQLEVNRVARDKKNAELAEEAAAAKKILDDENDEAARITAETDEEAQKLYDAAHARFADQLLINDDTPAVVDETMAKANAVVNQKVVATNPVIAKVAPVTPAPVIAQKSAKEILAEKAAMIDKICVLKNFVPTIWGKNYLLNSRCKSYRSLKKEIDEMIIHGPAKEKIFNCCYALGIPATGISRLAFLVTENITTEQIIAVNMSKGLTSDEIIAKYCPLKDEESFIDIDIMNAVGGIGYDSDVDPEYNSNIQLWEDMVKKGAKLEEIQILAKVVLDELESAEIAVVEELPAIQAVEEAPEVKSKIEELIEAAEVVETPAEPIDLLKELLKDPALAAHIEPAPAVEPVKAEIGVAQNDDEVKLPTEAEVRDWSLDIVNHNKFDKVVLKAIRRAGITTIGQLLSLNSKEFADKLPKKPLIFAGQIDEAKSVAENFVLKHITPAQISAEPKPVEEKTE